MVLTLEYMKTYTQTLTWYVLNTESQWLQQKGDVSIYL